MPKAFTEWKVLGHGPIEELAENLWRVVGDIPGMSLKRTMTVVRSDSGELLVHNPIAMDPASMAKLDAWGRVAWIVVPNGGHRLDAPAYKNRYPSALVLAPVGQRAKVEEVVRVDATFDAFDADANGGATGIRFEKIAGVADAEGAMFVTSKDGVTLVLNDIVFNMDRKTDPLGWFFTTVLGSAPGPRVSRLTKLVYVKDKKALRADLERFAGTPGLVRLIVAHEKVAHGTEAAAALRQAATYL